MAGDDLVRRVVEDATRTRYALLEGMAHEFIRRHNLTPDQCELVEEMKDNKITWSLRKKQGTAVEGKYGLILTEKKTFHPGEPVFLLRATDPKAPATIRRYAGLCREINCSGEHIDACLNHALRVEAWQLVNPTLVKERPD